MSVILLRTSVKSISTSKSNNQHLFYDQSDPTIIKTQVVSEVKNLKIQFTKITKVSINNLKTLLNGLDSVEKFSMKNVKIDFSNINSTLSLSQLSNKNNTESLIESSFKLRSKRSKLDSSLLTLNETLNAQLNMKNGDVFTGKIILFDNVTTLNDNNDSNLKYKHPLEVITNSTVKFDQKDKITPNVSTTNVSILINTTLPTPAITTSTSTSTNNLNKTEITSVVFEKDTFPRNLNENLTTTTTTATIDDALNMKKSTFSISKSENKSSSSNIKKNIFLQPSVLSTTKEDVKEKNTSLTYFNLCQYFPKLKSLQLDSLFSIESNDNSLALKILLSHCQQLQVIHLNNNQISSLLDDTFSSSGETLKRLYLMNNGLNEIAESAFKSLKSLEILDISNNNLTSISSNIFKDLLSLSSLRISKNPFQQLPEDLFSSSHELKSLNLNFNQKLSDLPSNLLTFSPSIQNFSVVDCGLVSLSQKPDQLFKHSNNIEHIELRGNKLKNLTTRGLFAYNSIIKKIDVSYNDIEVISGEIFSLNSTNLLELNLYGNSLTSIQSSTFSYLKNLKVLKLGFNDLTVIPAELFYSFYKLEELDLSRNKLTTFNGLLSRLPFGLSSSSLRKINFSKNNLTDFNEFSVIDWSLHIKISNLNLSGNKIAGRITLPVFQSTATYIELDLTSNLITSIDMEQVIAHETAIFNLIKSQNETINDHDDDLPSLSSLSRFRSIDYLTRKRILPYSNVLVLLKNNHLNCDCLLEQFVSYINPSSSNSLPGITKSVSFDIHELKCPKGNSLIQVNPSNLTCDLVDEKICPNNCSCIYRSFDETVIIDCSNRGLSKIPQSIVSPISYTNISIGVTSHLTNKSTLSTVRDGGEGRTTTTTTPVFNNNSSSSLLSVTKDSFGSTFELIYKVKKVILLLNNNFIESLLPINQIFSNKESHLNPRTSQFLTEKGSSNKIYFDVYLDKNKIEKFPLDFFLQSTASASTATADDEKVYVKSEITNSTHSTESTETFTSISSRSLGSLRLLSLRSNQFTFIPKLVLDNLDKFCQISTSKVNKINNTSIVQDFFVQDVAFKLFLGHNPYNCTLVQPNCEQLYLKNWLNMHFNIVQDVRDVKCTSSTTNSKVEIINAVDALLCPVAQSNISFVIAIICLITASILLVFSVFYYRNQQTVLALIYIYINPIFICFNLVDESDVDREKIYDAFISYSSADRDIVMEIIDKLEQPSDLKDHSISYLRHQTGIASIHEKNSDQIVPEYAVTQSHKLAKFKQNEINDSHYYTLCIHERDWLPGNLISWNIVNSVQNSRRTILIISKEFLNSIWFQVEFHTAYYQMLEDQIDRLIVVVRGDLPPKDQMDKDLVYLLTTKTYLVWGEKWFWQKLRYAMPHQGKKVKTKNEEKKITDKMMRQYIDNTINQHYTQPIQTTGPTIVELSHINRAFVGDT